MRYFFLVSFLFISGCSSGLENSQFKEQTEIIVNKEDLVDFQSSSAVADWSPSAMKEIDEIFDDLLPTIHISSQIQEYDPTIIVPLEKIGTTQNDNLIVEINKKYYSAVGDPEIVKQIIEFSKDL
ncbi:glycine/sarcosine/betaine reductase selenoprotein B family protein [Brevibacillus nitrificans]|uniref:glycine/sarcosine/betaine reductase selenoprotein B family protein n=1 Tax=Brevibacillus nitrificans TaxID=651560 RepID=UPI002617DE14|nr:glycine/sarcosine/betaine reductase selenoprotein B family protein [Brevibacillus nitrificans]